MWWLLFEALLALFDLVWSGARWLCSQSYREQVERDSELSRAGVMVSVVLFLGLVGVGIAVVVKWW